MSSLKAGVGALILALGSGLEVTSLCAQQAATTHPLDALSSDELRRATSLLRSAGAAGPQTRYAFLALSEPDKAVVRDGRSDRAADAIMFDWASFVASRATVDLNRGVVARVETLSVRHPPSSNLVIWRMDEAVRSDPRWRAAVAARGLKLDRVGALPSGLREGDTLRIKDGVRVSLLSAYNRDAPPPEDEIAGILGTVDLTNARVLSFSDAGKGGQRHLDSATAAALRNPRSLSKRSAAPSGARSFQRRGSEIRWENWRLHVGVHPRRGLELYDVAWLDGDRVRPVLYRASVSEMIAPYGDPMFGVWFPRDEGDIGLGHYSRSSIVPLADAPPNAELIDAMVHDDKGEPLTVPRAIAVYERDGGVLWRHAQQSRRSRQLVLTSMATVDNYDYAFEWVFGMDGSIDVTVGLTGVMNLRQSPLVRDSATHHEAGVFGHLVAPRIFAPNHQHFFSYRLDFDVDGSAHNAVTEMESQPEPMDSTNRRGLWFRMRERVLDRESQAQRSLNLASARKWRIISTTATNSLGQPTGFALIPGENSLALSDDASPVAAKAGWLKHHVWVTPFSPAEMHAGGDYQRHERPGDGLATWTRADRALRDTDVVLWYTFGITHIPRAEDFPFMPAHRTGFRLVPSGFFARNPALNAPIQ